MTSITIDDDMINALIAVSHYKNAQEAVITILSSYLQQHKKEQPLLSQHASQNYPLQWETLVATQVQKVKAKKKKPMVENRRGSHSLTNSAHRMGNEIHQIWIKITLCWNDGLSVPVKPMHLQCIVVQFRLLLIACKIFSL